MELTCNTCHQAKHISDFTKCKPCSNGVRNTCKVCTRQYKLKYDKDNHKKVSEYNEQYRKDNADKYREYMTEYNLKSEVKRKKREYYDTSIQYYRDLEKTKERKLYRYHYNRTSHLARWRAFLNNTLNRRNERK